MNTLKALLLALFAVGLLMCSTSTSPEDEFEPRQIGNFMLVAPNQADWIGESSQSKTMSDADTVIIEQPGQRDLTLVKDSLVSESVKFNMQFIDSTVTNADSVDIREAEFSGTKETDVFTQVSSRKSLNPERFRAAIGLHYACGESVPNGYNIQLDVYGQDKLFRRYIILSSGFMDVLNDEFCN